MKKSVFMILALALLASLLLGVAPAMAETFTLLEWDTGVKIEVLGFRVYEGNPASLRVEVRIVNDTGFDIWTKITDARLDSTPVTSAGRTVKAHTDSGTEDPLVFTFFPADDAGPNANEEICSARTVDMTIGLVDSNSYKTYYSTHVTFDLINSRAKPNGGLDNTSASDYHMLSKGSRGEAVRALQQRLIDLGYLTDKADGVYGTMTTAAVRSFCEQNGLTISNDASPDMQAVLFSKDAKSYVEPWIPLMIGQQFRYDPVKSVNTFFFKAQVTNTSKSRTIRGFEMNVYTTDVWGEKLGSGVTYSQTMGIMVGPGETVWSNAFNLGSWYSTDTVWVGISRIVFDDGEIRDIDDVIYFPCQITR